jgi:hypothetical protein
MNPKQFLVAAGVILIILGILGFAGVLGPTAARSVAGANWWFDRRESLGSLLLGIIAVIASMGSIGARRAIAVLIGVLGVLGGLYTLFISRSFAGAHFENPADIVFLFVIGLWGLLASGGSQTVVVERETKVRSG